MRVGIALGSNLGDRAAELQAAVRAIREFTEPPVLLSRVYETAPVDCPAGSPSFLNAVIEVGWSADISSLLALLQGVEMTQGRPGVHARNAPRTVDLDILYADELILKTPTLELPHPRLKIRAFVLLPLADILPNQKIPGDVKTPEDYIKTVDISGCKLTQVSLN
jgi:2-amino-4-hydroxy-6-hydroxymethyldihydropteridine diphosphokinase